MAMCQWMLRLEIKHVGKWFIDGVIFGDCCNKLFFLFGLLLRFDPISGRNGKCGNRWLAQLTPHAAAQNDRSNWDIIPLSFCWSGGDRCLYSTRSLLPWFSSLLTFRLRLKFSCMMELSRYPLDTQICAMQISSCKSIATPSPSSCLKWLPE